MADNSDAMRLVRKTVSEAFDDLEHGRSPLGLIARRVGEAVHADSASYSRLDARSGKYEIFAWSDLSDAGRRRLTHTTGAVPLSQPVLQYWRSGPSSVADGSPEIDRAAVRSETLALLMGRLGRPRSGGISYDLGEATIRALVIGKRDDFRPEEVRIFEDLRGIAIALAAHAEWLGQERAATRLNEIQERSSRVGLTTRERQVLELLASGMPASAMASRLSISPRTVHRHLSHIYCKLGSHDRLSAVMRAQDEGLLRSARLPAHERPRDVLVAQSGH